MSSNHHNPPTIPHTSTVISFFRNMLMHPSLLSGKIKLSLASHSQAQSHDPRPSSTTQLPNWRDKSSCPAAVSDDPHVLHKYSYDLPLWPSLWNRNRRWRQTRWMWGWTSTWPQRRYPCIRQCRLTLVRRTVVLVSSFLPKTFMIGVRLDYMLVRAERKKHHFSE